MIKVRDTFEKTCVELNREPKSIMENTLKQKYEGLVDTSYYEECEVEFSPETIEAINEIDSLFDSQE